MVGVLLLQQPAVMRLEGRAVAITDGDTFTLDTGAQRLKIRLSAIDTPEVSQPYGEQATQALPAPSLARGGVKRAGRRTVAVAVGAGAAQRGRRRRPEFRAGRRRAGAYRARRGGLESGG